MVEACKHCIQQCPSSCKHWIQTSHFGSLRPAQKPSWNNHLLSMSPHNSGRWLRVNQHNLISMLGSNVLHFNVQLKSDPYSWSQQSELQGMEASQCCLPCTPCHGKVCPRLILCWTTCLRNLVYNWTWCNWVHSQMDKQPSHWRIYRFDRDSYWPVSETWTSLAAKEDNRFDTM